MTLVSVLLSEKATFSLILSRVFLISSIYKWTFDISVAVKCVDAMHFEFKKS